MTIATWTLAVAALLYCASASAANDAFAQAINVPTLSEIGLAALIAGVGAVGGWVIRRRGKKK